MVQVYYDQDADLGYLSGKKIAIIGYGSQGHAQAQNLKDSGLDVIVGLRRDLPDWDKAVSDGLTVTTVPEAAAAGDIIQMLVPDELQARIYKEEIEPHLAEGNALMFSHGFNIHYGQIVPPANVDVFMVAPKGPGHMVRRMYLEGKGVPSLVAVFQDYTGKAKDVGLAYAKGIGGTRAILKPPSRKKPRPISLEAAVLCGGVTELIGPVSTPQEAGYARKWPILSVSTK